MATFEEQFPSLNGKRKDILGDRTGQEWSGFYIDEDDVKANCLDKQRVIEELLFRIKQHEHNREIVAMLTGIIERLSL